MYIRNYVKTCLDTKEDERYGTLLPAVMSALTTIVLSAST